MRAGAEYYQRDRDRHPPAYAPGYKTSVSRSPRQSLISLQQSVSEITGPVFGQNDIGPLDHDVLALVLFASLVEIGVEELAGQIDQPPHHAADPEFGNVGAETLQVGARNRHLVERLGVLSRHGDLRFSHGLRADQEALTPDHAGLVQADDGGAVGIHRSEQRAPWAL